MIKVGSVGKDLVGDMVPRPAFNGVVHFIDFSLSLVAVYSSISETTDSTRMVEEGYYAAPKSMEKASHHLT